MSSAAYTAAWPSDWPELDPLGGELPAVPAFDVAMLPVSLQPLVSDVAQRMQVPVDLPAVATLALLSGLCGRRAQIQPKARDTSWKVVPNLWGAYILPSGNKKTPTMNAIMAPARAIEANWRREHAEAMAQYETAQERVRLDAQCWAEAYKHAKKSGKAIPEKPEDNAVPPTQKRFIVVDTTAEQLQMLLSQNPAGLFCVWDELTGWLKSLDKQGREAERAFYLVTWNGDGSFTVDRIGRGTVHIDHCCVSLFGGIQPGPLQDYLAHSLASGDDGLFARFQLVTWPDCDANWEYCDRIPDADALRAAEVAYARIASIPLEQDIVLRFENYAQKLFVDWLTHLESRLRRGELAGPMLSHLSKFRSLMPSLALLLSLADGEMESVGLEHTRNAALLCDYFEAHARRIYASRATPERASAQSLGRKLQEGWRRDFATFTLRDVYRNEWSGLSTPEEVRAAILILEQAGWVRLKQDGKSSKGGRPSETFEISPRIGGMQ